MSSSSIIQAGDYPGLIIDPETPSSSPSHQVDLKLENREDLYATKFIKQGHFNYICREPSNAYYVISVLSCYQIVGKTTKHIALKTTQKGSEEFELVVAQEKNVPLEALIERTLIKEGHNSVFINDPTFPTNFLSVEQKHPQKRSTMKIAVVNCKFGQVDPKAMLANGRGNTRCSPRFWKFIDSISEQKSLTGWTGYRGDMREPGFAHYTKWGNIEIIFHVAPSLDEEETRRLIGNDVGYIIFLDEGWNTKFNPQNINLFGEVPQVFAVVQPEKEGYRIGFFQRRNILPHGPRPPSYRLTLEETRDFILTKLYNGLTMTTYCPPLNRLFYKPRQETLDTLCKQTLAQNSHKKQQLLNDYQSFNTPKRNQKLSMDDQVTFILDATGYNPVNALVLFLMTNLAYFEGSELKNDCHEQLGFSIDCIQGFSHKTTETYGFVAYDKEKLFLVFRAHPFRDKVKKCLARGKKDKIEVKNSSTHQTLQLAGFVFSIFAKSIVAIWDIVEIIMTKLYKNQQVFVCGYDTGGCLSILAAHLMHLMGYKINAVYTYGSPKVGDQEWSQSYPAQLNQNTFRVAHHSDFVPAHPPEICWYHVGKLHSIGSGKSIEPNPHSMECYFNSLVPAHRALIEEMQNKINKNLKSPRPIAVDRIIQSTPNIRERISKREAREARESTDHTRKSGVIDEDDLAARGLKKQASAPPPKTLNSNKNDARMIRRRSTGHMKPLMEPNLLAFFKDTLRSVLETNKNIRSIVYGNTVPDQLKTLIIDATQKLKKMDSVVKEVDSNGNEVIAKFTDKIKEFLDRASRLCEVSVKVLKAGLFPPARALIDQYDVLFSSIVPIVVEINETSKALLICN